MIPEWPLTRDLFARCTHSVNAYGKLELDARVYVYCKEHAAVFVTRAVIRAYSSHLACVHGEAARSVHTPLIRDLRFHGADERSDTIKWSPSGYTRVLNFTRWSASIFHALRVQVAGSKLRFCTRPQKRRTDEPHVEREFDFHGESCDLTWSWCQRAKAIHRGEDSASASTHGLAFFRTVTRRATSINLSLLSRSVLTGGNSAGRLAEIWTSASRERVPKKLSAHRPLRWSISTVQRWRASFFFFFFF